MDRVILQVETSRFESYLGFRNKINIDTEVKIIMEEIIIKSYPYLLNNISNVQILNGKLKITGTINDSTASIVIEFYIVDVDKFATFMTYLKILALHGCTLYMRKEDSYSEEEEVAGFTLYILDDFNRRELSLFVGDEQATIEKIIGKGGG